MMRQFMAYGQGVAGRPFRQPFIIRPDGTYREPEFYGVGTWGGPSDCRRWYDVDPKTDVVIEAVSDRLGNCWTRGLELPEQRVTLAQEMRLKEILILYQRRRAAVKSPEEVSK